MKQKLHPQGGALLLSMLVIVTFAGIVTVGQMLSSSQILLTSRAADVDSMQSTAEGLLEYAYGVWKPAMTASDTPLTTAEATALVATGRPTLPSWMSYSSFTISAMDLSGATASSATLVPTISQQPKGWQANSYQYVAQVTLVSNNNKMQRKVTMSSVLRHDLVPPVNGLFYSEGDFELYKPAPMIIGGNVHTNANGFVSTHYSDAASRLRFLPTSNISYVGNYQHAIPPGAALWSPITSANDVQAPTYDRGYANQVSQSAKLEGIGMGTSSEFDTSDTNPNNDGNHELIEKPVAGYTDPAGIANSRIYNNAGLVIDISGPTNGTVSVTNPSTGVYTGNNVTITAKNGTTLTTAKAAAIIGAISNSKTVSTTTSQYVYNSSKKKYEWQNVTTTSVVQNTMYDKREGSDVLVSDVNLGSVNSTLNSLAGFNDIVYINNTSTSYDHSGIRITNAGVLPTDGLTVATSGGMYVIGDYNTGKTTSATAVPSNASGNPDGTSTPYVSGYTTKPAALVADAIMFLSNNWSDDNDSSSLSSRTASHTTINSAVIAGYIPSEWNNPDTGETYWYSGGANNFPRFLENWSNKGMTFYGAFVQLYKSKMFTGEWNTGDIYSPPNRRWNFDQLLLQRVIPGIPAASVFSRGQVRTL